MAGCKLIRKLRLWWVSGRLGRMGCGGITDQLEAGWTSYTRWRDRRVKVCSWIDGVSHRYENMVEDTKTIIAMVALLFVFGFASCVIPLSQNPMFVLITMCLVGIPMMSIPLYGIVRLVGKIIRPVDYAKGIGGEMAWFLKHHHGRLKTFYKVFMPGGRRHRRCSDDDYTNPDKSACHGVGKILGTIWSCQTCDPSDVFGIDGLHEEDVYTTYQLIRFMWAGHRAPLRFSRHETGLLVGEWVSLLSGWTDWSTYDGMVRSMIPEVIEATFTREARDKNSILERLESIKRDSDVVNGSPDVARMRDLAGRVHESNVRLVGEMND